MNDLIDKLRSKTCENCRFRGTLSFNYPCCVCLEPEETLAECVNRLYR